MDPDVHPATAANVLQAQMAKLVKSWESLPPRHYGTTLVLEIRCSSFVPLLVKVWLGRYPRNNFDGDIDRVCVCDGKF